MSFSVGIVGLPNVGKSTLFQAITKKQVEAKNYPFCTIEPNVGTVKVPDPKLDKLAEVLQATQKVPTTIEFVDIAGLVKGASQGEGLGNKFLANIREVDMICQVVRDFEDSKITHVHNKINPLSDVETINLELILADLESAQKALARLQKKARTEKNKELQQQLAGLEKVIAVLEKGQLAQKASLSFEEKKQLKCFNFLTLKPFLYLRNIQDKPLHSLPLEPLLDLNIKLEKELAELDPEEAKLYRQELGADQNTLDDLIVACYRLLDLITFYSAGFKAINQAWTIPRGATAPQAAGVIHSDFEKGFIRAEVINVDDLIACGSEAKAREKGLLRTEGKDYLIQEGDVCNFLWSK